ncbi:MAG: hypothetical protein AAGI15_01930 [Pseudomonadota bacterium]
MDNNPQIRLLVPKPALEALSYCATTESALADWVAGLPMANTTVAARQVHAGVTEVAALTTTASARLALLEILRPPVHYLAARLDRASLSTGDEGEELAALAQALQSILCTGYKAVVRDAMEELDGSRSSLRDTLPKAIHRAISDLSRQHLRTLQLYVAPPPKTWLEPNQLYLLAERLELDQYRLADSENHTDLSLSITDVYLRLALMSCCRPNQLRHRHLGRIFSALEDWSSRAIISTDLPDAQFVVDLAADHSPMYAALNRDASEPRGIRTDVLVYEIDAYLKDIDSSLPIPDYITPNLLSQLTVAWGKISPRAHRRLPSDERLMVCVGLRATHYFLSGGVEFSEQVFNSDTLLRSEINPFVTDGPGMRDRSERDVWDQAFDVGGSIPLNPNIGSPESLLREAREQTKDKTVADALPSGMQFYEAAALDTSPNGYRMRWPDPLPPNLQAGELLAVREAADPRWCAAVLRWIRQDEQGTTTGIELLSPRAIPLAIRVIQKKGGPTDFARGLLLPEIKPIGQSATLITPRMPFTAGQKVHVHRQGVQNTAQLQQLVTTTDSFNQFTFKMLDGYLEKSQIDLNIQSVSALTGSQEPGATTKQ